MYKKVATDNVGAAVIPKVGKDRAVRDAGLGTNSVPNEDCYREHPNTTNQGKSFWQMY